MRRLAPLYQSAASIHTLKSMCLSVAVVLFIDGSPYGVGDSVRLRPPLTFVTTTSTTTQSPTEIRQHLNSQSREELVRPTKLPPKPMHTVDMLTEMHMKDAAGGESFGGHTHTHVANDTLIANRTCIHTHTHTKHRDFCEFLDIGNSAGVLV